MNAYKPRFIKPRSTDIPWQEDKSDVNPIDHTSFVYNPNVSLSIEHQRRRLPIYQNRNHIIHLLEKHQTLILVGETGCGKSTQVCQYLHEAGWGSDGKIIGISQPRRVAATTLATRVAEERGCVVGQLVGYSIRFDDCFDAKQTRIKYMTEGILIREMMADPLLQHYCVLMLDEVHERTLYTDVLLGLLKKILKKRKDLRLIVSSATMDAEEMKHFFNFNTTANEAKDTAVIISIHGRTYPCEIYYKDEPVPDYVKGTVETVVKIHRTEPAGDILVFLTGQEEINMAVSLIGQYAEVETEHGTLWPLPMHGSLPPRDQLKVFRRTPKGQRKVVVATNIAETSVTILGIVYVIDCGFMKLRWFNSEAHMDALVVVPVSKASAEQRAGRAGRTRFGKVYRLYSEDEHAKMREKTVPEMQRSDLSSAVLQLKALGIDNILRFNFPSAPPAKNLALSLELLYALEAIDDDGQLTQPLGLQMAEFPLHPLLSKMLLASGQYGCSEEILSIVAMLQIESVFFSINSAKARIAKRKFEVEEGDLITLLNVYNAFVKCGRIKQWCVEHCLNYKGLIRAQEMRNRMEKMVSKFNVPLLSANGCLDTIRRCITAGLFCNAAYLHYSGNYHTVRGNQLLHIHPNSCLYTLEQPQWVLFVDILHTNKMYMKDLTVIEDSWLEELAPHFYKKMVVKDY